jgi:importin subunit beta-1
VQVVQAPLIAGLNNIEEYTVCAAAVGVLGDVCRSVGKSIVPYCDEIMKCLLSLLQSPALNRSVKPHVISVFADIAMAIEGDFARYVTVVMGILKQAGEVTINTDDEDMIEYINSLRNSILEAYSGMIQGLKEANQQDLILPGLGPVAEFIQRAGCDTNRSDEVLKTAVGLIGDIGQSYGAKVLAFLQQGFVSNMINDALLGQCNAEEVANWAKSVSIVTFL